MRDRGSDVRLGLLDLVGGLLFLVAKRGFAHLHLVAEALFALRGEGAVGAQLIGREDGEQLVRVDLVALLHEQPDELRADLRTHDDVVGRHDPGEHELPRTREDDDGDDENDHDRTDRYGAFPGSHW